MAEISKIKVDTLTLGHPVVIRSMVWSSLAKKFKLHKIKTFPNVGMLIFREKS